MSIDVSTAVSSAPVIKRGIFRQILRNPLAVASSVVLLIVVVVAILQPWIMPFPPQQVTLRLTNAPPFTSHYILGGDKFGRDILSRLIAGTRGAVIAALILASIALAIGVTFGLIAGYFGKIFDSISSWIFAVLIAAPGIIVLIALYTLIDVSTPLAMATLGVLSSPGIFYLVRTLTMTVRNELYVDAARVSGLSNFRIVGRHVLLAIKGPIIILAAFLSGGAIAVSAGLEFLGLGDPKDPTWGGMLNDAFTNYYIASWQLIWPGAALGIATAAFVLLGNAFRDTLEGAFVRPSARARRRQIASLIDETAVAKTLGASATAAALGTSVPDAALLDIEDLQICYAPNNELTTVVDGISLKVSDGEVVGLVGESGSGKTQTVFAALGLLPEQAIVARGSIRLGGVELLGMPEQRISHYRGTTMAYVPQEPLSNLDPSFTIGSQLVEGIRVQTTMSRRDAKQLALSTLARVGIRDPKRTFASYPHEISGGMAQRALIAGAIACKPRLLVADEPTTALDVTVQAEVLDLLRDLQRETGMGVLVVTHNFGVVADLCDRVIVMRTGKIVEEGPVSEVFANPQHEYTRQLLAAVLDETETRERTPRATSVLAS
ncbi:MAG TPA: dipeptide/oligopeptide/nickel ABC transporter permease/ATP-binding protein [Galbitalea sp.]|jgi:peptide/nickel transport system permease protein